MEFPEGTIIGLAKEKLPVVVTFKSDRPMSFTANMDFIDDDGTRYCMPITGIADASLLTMQPFAALNSSMLRWNADPSGPIMLQLGAYRMVDTQSVLGSTLPIAGLVKYLNVSTTKGPGLDNLRSQIMASRGRLLTELVELLSGRTVTMRSMPATTRKEAAVALCANYDAVLSFLRGQGCLINAVKPEMLLSFEDFCRVMDTRMKPDMTPQVSRGRGVPCSVHH